MRKEDVKKHLIVYGTFLGFIVLVFAILITLTLLARNSWKTGLANEVQNVLNDNYPDGYTVNKYIELDSLLNTNAAVYSLIKKGASNSDRFYGVIVRIPTITGPLPAVFIYNEDAQVNFVGFATETGKANDLVNIRMASGNMNYWESMIPKIIKKSKTK